MLLHNIVPHSSNNTLWGPAAMTAILAAIVTVGLAAMIVICITSAVTGQQ